MCLVTVNEVDKVAKEFGCEYTGTDNTYGHRSYKWFKTGKRIIFKYNPRTRKFYMRDPKYVRNGGYVNKTKTTEIHSIEQMKVLIDLSIEKNDDLRFYTMKYYTNHVAKQAIEMLKNQGVLQTA